MDRKLMEKYRPQTLDSVLGQDKAIAQVKNLIAKDEIPHMLFVGPAGTGKTTTAYAIARELNVPIVEFNASDERGIDVVRNKIKTLARTKGRRIILLDEFDMMTSDAQHSLRRIMEKSNAIFILTANEPWRIIDPIKSRCAIIEFNRLPDEAVMKIVINVIKGEGIKINLDEQTKEALKALIKYANGDARKVLNLIETMINDGREFTPMNIEALTKPGILEEAVMLAYDGDLDKAVQIIEDAYLMNELDSTLTMNQLYRTVKNMELDIMMKARIFMKLGEVEHNIKNGDNPLIQLASLLGTIWIYSHIPQE